MEEAGRKGNMTLWVFDELLEGVASMCTQKFGHNPTSAKPPNSFHIIRYNPSGQSWSKAEDVIVDDLILIPRRSSICMIWS